MAKRKAEFIISAKDEATKTLNSVAANLKGVGKLAVGALAGFASGAAAKSVFDMIRNANDLTGALEDSSTRLGIGINDLNAYQHSAKLAGVESEQLAALVTKLNKAAGEIKLNKSSEGMVAAFDRIGISVAQVKKSNPAQLYEDVIVGLGKIEDPAVRASTAMEIFGKSGAAALTIVKDGAEGLERAKALVKGLGLELSAMDVENAAKASDNLDDLGFAATVAKQKLAAELSPAIIMVTQLLLDSAKEGEGLGKSIENGVMTGVVVLDRMYVAGVAVKEGWVTIGDTVMSVIQAGNSQLNEWTADLIELLGTRGPDAYNYLAEKAEDGTHRVLQGVNDAANAVSNGVIDVINTAVYAIEGLVNKSADGLNSLIEMSNKVNPFGEIPMIGKVDLGRIAPEARKIVNRPDFGRMDPLGGDEVDFLRSESGRYMSSAISYSEKAEASFDRAGDAFRLLAEAEPGPILESFNDMKKGADKVSEAIGGGGEDYSGGTGIPAATEKAEKAIKEMSQTFSLLEEMGTAATSGIERAIDDLAQGGKITMKQFTASLLQDFAAITAKAAILGSLLGNSKYGGNGSGLIGQVASGYLSGFSSVPKAIPVSYDGGGFTGSGSRSGGVDGKGGFPAILHPNETVLDHTRGQGMSGGNTSVTNNYIIRETMAAGQVAAIRRAAAGDAVGQVRSINERGGKRRAQLNGRRR